MTKANLQHFVYTWRHKQAFLKTEKELIGKNTFSGYLHDVDKLFLYLFTPLSTKIINKIHRKHSKHHVQHKNPNFEQAIIDWECARLTKPDKPLNAYQTMLKYYPEFKEKLMPILEKWNLIDKN